MRTESDQLDLRARSYWAMKPRERPTCQVLSTVDGYVTHGNPRWTYALPWVLAHRSDLDLRALTNQIRSAGLQNRLGFLIEITVSAAKRMRQSEVTERLEPWLLVLREMRHADEDTLAKASMTEVERRRLRRSRSKAARFWRLLTDVNTKQAVKVVELGNVMETSTKRGS